VVKRPAQLAFGLVAVGATAALVVGQARPSGTQTLGSCPGSEWPTTAENTPALLGSGPAGYYVWHDRAGWHLRLKGQTGTVYSGRVVADAQLRVVHVDPAIASSLTAQKDRFSFRITGSGSVRAIDFRASCAGRLAFAFGTQTGASQAPTSGRPAHLGGGPAATSVFLGARGRAPAVAFALDRPASTGIEGRALIGPTCPVVKPSCPSAKPAQGTVRIETASTSKDGSGGRLVATVETSSDGLFRTEVPPGRYVATFVETRSGPGPGGPRPAVVDVESGVVSDVVIQIDTGIR
jgi:hypothetical protein